MLSFAPLGLLAGLLGWPGMAIFTLNALAILLLTNRLTFIMGEITLLLGENLGSIFNAIFECTGSILVCPLQLLFRFEILIYRRCYNLFDLHPKKSPYPGRLIFPSQTKVTYDPKALLLIITIQLF